MVPLDRQLPLPSIPLTSSAAAAKSLQSCPTLRDPRDGSPPGSSIPWILQARVLEWGAIAFSDSPPLTLTNSYSSFRSLTILPLPGSHNSLELCNALLYLLPKDPKYNFKYKKCMIIGGFKKFVSSMFVKAYINGNTSKLDLTPK